MTRLVTDWQGQQSCTGNCNQGRTNCDCDCVVASVKSISLVYMFIGCIGLMIFAIYIQPKNVTVQYDCRLAEIAVDYPIQVKQQCRLKMKKGVNHVE
jgi:hypothetical protein